MPEAQVIGRMARRVHAVTRVSPASITSPSASGIPRHRPFASRSGHGIFRNRASGHRAGERRRAGRVIRVRVGDQHLLRASPRRAPRRARRDAWDRPCRRRSASARGRESATSSCRRRSSVRGCTRGSRSGSSTQLLRIPHSAFGIRRLDGIDYRHAAAPVKRERQHHVVDRKECRQQKQRTTPPDTATASPAASCPTARRARWSARHTGVRDG